MALPCDVTAPTPDDSVALILWYKDDALAPIYTLDARKGESRLWDPKFGILFFHFRGFLVEFARV